tara:strand:+ start:177 stop:878 length:702 start_codon:yes stop_codon:yes gene_type:complete
MEAIILLIITAPAVGQIIVLVGSAHILKGLIHFFIEFFSDEAKLERNKLREIRRIKEQERAKKRAIIEQERAKKRAIIEQERLLHEQERAKERRRAEREEINRILLEKEKNEKEEVELFLRTYPSFTKFVKSYCSLITKLIPIVRYFLLIYGIFFFGMALLLMIDGIIFDGIYKNMIFSPLDLIMKNNLYQYAERIGNDNAGIIVTLMLCSFSFFIYGRSKVKKWVKYEEEKN